MKIFPSVTAALQAGFQVWDDTRYPILVRTRTAKGLALALALIPGRS